MRNMKPFQHSVWPGSLVIQGMNSAGVEALKHLELAVEASLADAAVDGGRVLGPNYPEC